MDTTSAFYDLWINGMVSMAIIGVVACGGAFYVVGRKSVVPWLFIALSVATVLFVATLPLYSPGFRDIFANRRKDATTIERTGSSAPYSVSAIPEQ